MFWWIPQETNIFHQLTTSKSSLEQESPPACIEYSFCCPTWVPPPLSWPGRRGGRYLTRVPLPTPPPLAGPGRVPPRLGYPPADLAGYPLLAGYLPPRRTWQGPPSRISPRCLPHGILGNVAKHYGIWVPPPGVDRLKTLPSPSIGCGR